MLTECKKNYFPNSTKDRMLLQNCKPLLLQSATEIMMVGKPFSQANKTGKH